MDLPRLFLRLVSLFSFVVAAAAATPAPVLSLLLLLVPAPGAGTRSGAGTPTGPGTGAVLLLLLIPGKKITSLSRRMKKSHALLKSLWTQKGFLHKRGRTVSRGSHR
jgi:hypothetical protein